MAVLSYLLGGVLVYGGLGWLGSHYLDQIWMVPVGILVGIGLSVLLISRRYSRGDVIDQQLRQMLDDRERQQEYWAAEARKSNGS
jgi:ATP synthase protein I